MPDDPGQGERRIQTFCLLILAAVAAGVALYWLRPVLIPFVLALFLVYCLIPVIDVQMHYLGIGRVLAVINTILFGCVLFSMLWVLVWTSVSQMTANAADYETQFRQLLTNVADGLPLERFGITGENLSILQIPDDASLGLLRSIAGSIMSIMSNGLLVVIFMIFLTAGKAAPPQAWSIREEINSRVKRYIVTKVLVSAATGTLVGLVLAILRVDLALVFGLLAFLLNFIPSIGSVIATLLPLPVVVLSPDLSQTAKVLAIAIPGGIQFAIGSVVEPKIMGSSLDLHPVVVLLGLIFFGTIWGIVGMILATPIVAVIKIVLERIEITAPIAHLLAGRMGQSRGVAP